MLPRTAGHGGTRNGITVLNCNYNGSAGDHQTASFYGAYYITTWPSPAIARSHWRGGPLQVPGLGVPTVNFGVPTVNFGVPTVNSGAVGRRGL